MSLMLVIQVSTACIVVNKNSFADEDHRKISYINSFNPLKLKLKFLPVNVSDYENDKVQ